MNKTINVDVRSLTWAVNLPVSAAKLTEATSARLSLSLNSGPQGQES